MIAKLLLRFDQDPTLSRPNRHLDMGLFVSPSLSLPYNYIHYQHMVASAQISLAHLPEGKTTAKVIKDRRDKERLGSPTPSSISNRKFLENPPKMQTPHLEAPMMMNSKM